MNAELRSLAAGIGIVALALLACKGSKTEAGTTDASATPSASAAPKEPVVDVTRYPDEQAASGTAKAKGAAVARQAATASAKLVGSLKDGDEVGLVAAHEGFVLVSVTDDGVAGQLGWVPRDAFGDLPGIAAKPLTAAPTTAVAPLKYVSCPAGQAAAGTKGECVVVCTDPAPCAKATDACVQTSFVSSNVSVKNVRVCQAPGAGVKLRAVVPGGPWLNDQVPKIAGSASAATAPAAAGVTSDFAQPNAAGDCPKGFTTNQGMTCSRVCTSNAQCHAPNTCVKLPVGNTKVCDSGGA